MATIQVGDKVPDFSATTEEGSSIRLADFLGQRSLVLFFYPKDGSPICTKEACSFRDNLGRVEKLGATVLGVSKDSLASHEKFRDKHDLNFPLLSDPGGDIVTAYGAWKEKKRKNGETYLGINRSTVLIDPSPSFRRASQHAPARNPCLAARHSDSPTPISARPGERREHHPPSPPDFAATPARTPRWPIDPRCRFASRRTASCGFRC